MYAYKRALVIIAHRLIPKKLLSTEILKIYVIIQKLMYCLQNEAAVVDCSPMLLLDLMVNLYNELKSKFSTNKITELSHPTQADTATSFPSALATFR